MVLLCHLDQLVHVDDTKIVAVKDRDKLPVCSESAFLNGTPRYNTKLPENTLLEDKNETGNYKDYGRPSELTRLYANTKCY
ncbi:hypothetical protein Hamer_G023951 [Homarus americanus]|uniref:Uncharacterized protein n=1 Tax=Homarus americanus TaxID=6706 RepID=A0A8J5K2Q9_HOMAM|nr:hypothetical protein Hamer_G023951 [Homarus americanus]